MDGRFYDYRLLRARRQAAGLTLEMAAKQLKIHPVSLSRIECGHSCSPELLARYALILHVPWLDFLQPAPLGKEKSAAT